MKFYCNEGLSIVRNLWQISGVMLIESKEVEVTDGNKGVDIIYYQGYRLNLNGPLSYWICITFWKSKLSFVSQSIYIFGKFFSNSRSFNWYILFNIIRYEIIKIASKCINIIIWNNNINPISITEDTSQRKHVRFVEIKITSWDRSRLVTIDFEINGSVINIISEAL